MEMYKRITNSNKFTKIAVSKSLNKCVFNKFTGIIYMNNYYILKKVLFIVKYMNVIYTFAH